MSELQSILDAVKTGDRNVVTEALAAFPGDHSAPDSTLVAAIAVKESGFNDLARTLLTSLTKVSPDYALGHYELAVMDRYAGEHHAAITRLRTASRLDPKDFRIRFLLAHLLFAVRDTEEALAVAGALDAFTDDQQRQVESLVSWGRYVQTFSKGRARRIGEEVRRTHHWLGPHEVAERIRGALETRTGFALVRLGDGEGVFAQVSPEDELAYKEIYQFNRQNWTSFLFGEGFDAQFTGYASLTGTLMSEVVKADILGIPYPTWVDYEYDTASLQGVPCLLNIHRWLLANRSPSPPAVCDQLMHGYLHNDGLIEPILRSQSEISLISCLPSLPELLKERFGIKDVEFYQVPSEKTAPHLSGMGITGDGHFPLLFWTMIQRLSQPHHGRLFIVAAGTLGKYYATVIKRHGGVALDLGSIVDAWSRLASRPMYRDL